MSDQDPYGDPTQVDLPPVDATQAMPTTPGTQPPTSPPPPGEPPGEAPDRRPWILGGLLAVVLLVGLTALLLNDDDATTSDTTTSSTTTSESTTTTEATTTTTEATTTTTEATTTTTEAPPSTVDPARCVSSSPDDPDTTALVVFDAWTLGDRPCAANLMTSDALDQLFALGGDTAGMDFAGCFDQDDPDPHTLCAFTYEGGSTQLRMNYSETEGWTVYEVFQSAD